MNAAFDTEEDFSDDEDDDEDDGHSSMLSNASLRRRKALASGAPASNPQSKRSTENSASMSTGGATYVEREVRLEKSASVTRLAFDLVCSGAYSSLGLAKGCALLPWLR